MSKTTLLATVLLVASAASAQPGIEPLKVMAELDGLTRESLWPGFRPAAIPVAIFDGERTHLFRHRNPPEELVKAPAEAGKEAVWVMPGRHPAIVANSSAEIGGAWTATVMPAPDGEPDLPGRAALILHEMFHVFQRQRHEDWRQMANETHLFTYPLTDVANGRGRILENLALARAVESEEDETAAAWAAAFLEIRDQRYQAIAESSARYERGIELVEGTANYVELLALGKAADSSQLRTGFAAADVRRRSYASGRALAVLLDRFDPWWKIQMERSPTRPLDQILRDALAEMKMGTTPAAFSPQEQADAAREAAEKVAALRRQLGAKREEFEALPGLQVVVRAAAMEPLWPRGFDPINVLRLDERQVLHRRFLKAGNDAGSLEMMGAMAMTVGIGEHPLFNGISEVRIAGFSTAPRLQVNGDRVKLEADELTLKFRGARVQKKAGAIVVLLGSSPP